ncbi:aminotransferase class I/II-fold pyridoxal phosphate-dependent enzyme [Aliicoccus persicus]|uniref:Orn/Lys/Arg decarboxylase, major domain n=1 Tax=Aliicoccus persicus TaxID=930138 RepID=A0A662Z3K5_9STAP|nr:aminotransferase class I/II-fold pyridoxal phosphate-dependent enzyme [Aliicoccus persicus]SEW05480.1 Orn/Lys/Arg decarboxylase, major domain [Aliicoccus persicus]
MRKKLIEQLNELEQHRAISLHVPGHKNSTIGHLDILDIAHDKTEIVGLDNLHEPEEVLMDLNDFLSEKYKGYIAQVLTNGSTTGIIAAILAYKEIANRYIIMHNAHKSVHHGIDLAHHEPVITNSIYDIDLLPNDIVIVTYPTYEGRTEDIERIIEHVHGCGAYIIVDEAHGAHFDITPKFPKSAMNFDADIVIQSYHKMLPALTMGSVIFVNNRNISTYRHVMKYVNYIETSSPSYLVMASIESAHEFYLNYSDELFFLKRQMIFDALKQVGCIVGPQDDPAKLLVKHREHTVYELEQALIDSHIYPEMTTEDGVLFILPLSHEDDRYPYHVLLSRLEALNFVKNDIKTNDELYLLSNKVCIQHIIPYPPGVPFVRKGEVITAGDVKTLIHLYQNRVKIEGVTSNIEYYIDRER